MRYISYTVNGKNHVGVLEGDSIVPLIGLEAIDANHGTDELRNAGRREEDRTPLDAVKVLPASPSPARVLCVGLNYRSHILETGRDLPTYPVLFPKYASNLIGANDDIQLPPESTETDYEGELAIVIGKRGRRIDPAAAMDHVLGFTVANDITMRDFQYKTHQWLQGKAWDRSTPLGPVIVTPDEFELDTASIRTILNGEVVQEAPVSDLVFDVPTLVGQISTFTELQPGDVILTGTPGGVGYRRKPRLLLAPGDVVTVEVDGIGAVTNTVTAEVVEASAATESVAAAAIN